MRMHQNENKFAKARIVASIEARMSSTRLPGKVLMKLAGQPMLGHIIDRLRASQYIHEVVVATTTNQADEAIVNFCLQKGVLYFRGSEEDVLGRVVDAGRFARADLLVEITGDCPLTDPLVVDDVIRSFLESDADYCSNGLDEKTYVRGLDVEVYPLAVLEEVESLANEPSAREHVSYYIYTHPEKFVLKSAACSIPPEAAKLRLTVDCSEDFRLADEIYKDLYSQNKMFGIAEVMELFSRRPELFEINAEIEQKPVI
jgi:spore coat polysaccharide biosynthesis protein SpsF